MSLIKLLKTGSYSLLLLTSLTFLSIEENATANDFMQNTRTISGMVSDNKGETLIGMSVMIKGTTIGTVTDINGAYSLSGVADYQVLEFSYVGFEKQEVVVQPNQQIINIIMQDVSIR